MTEFARRLICVFALLTAAVLGSVCPAVATASDETNNTMSSDFFVDGPDLYVSEFVSDRYGTPGEPFHVSYTIVNEGDWVSSDFTLTFKLKEPGDCGVPGTPEYEFESVLISGSNDFVYEEPYRFASQELDLWVNPCEARTIPTTWICMEVDTEFSVDETSETNNFATARFETLELDGLHVNFDDHLDSPWCGAGVAVPGEEYSWGFHVLSFSDDMAGVVDAPMPSEFTGGTWSRSSASCYWEDSDPRGATEVAGTGSVHDAVELQLFDGYKYDISWIVAPDAVGSTTAYGTVEYELFGSSHTDTAQCPVSFTPEADLAISVDNGTDVVSMGDRVSYTITVTNPGPSDAPGAFVENDCSGDVMEVEWSCVATGGAVCASSGVDDIMDVVDLPAGSMLVYTFNARVHPEASIMNLLHIASVSCPSGVTERNAADNSATDEDEVVPAVFIDDFEDGDTSAWSTAVR